MLLLNINEDVHNDANKICKTKDERTEEKRGVHVTVRKRSHSEIGDHKVVPLKRSNVTLQTGLSV